MTIETSGATRFDRRKARTRASLVAAAQTFIAEGRTGVPIQDVTERADVGIGTFYNHFSSKEELFEAAIADALEQYAVQLDALGGDADDPAMFFAQSFRLAGRLHRTDPHISRVLLAHAHDLSRSRQGIGPRARRDIAAAHQAGLFHAPDVDLAMVLVTGAMVELGHLLHDQPERDAATATDTVTENLLVALGMTREGAAQACGQPLPEV